DRARYVADRVAAAGIAVICLPLTNLYLQGRDHTPAPRGLTALRILRAAGVTVAAGGDHPQGPFNGPGRADPMEVAGLLVLAGHETPASAYSAVSGDARRALGLSTVARQAGAPAATEAVAPAAIEPGAPAELLAIKAGSLRGAVAEASPE